MKNELNNNDITISPLELSKAVEVTQDMARKYLSGYSEVSITKAVIFEEKFNIPVKKWAEIRKKYLKGLKNA